MDEDLRLAVVHLVVALVTELQMTKIIVSFLGIESRFTRSLVSMVEIIIIRSTCTVFHYNVILP